MTWFDFYRDPLGAMKPGMTFEDVYKAGVADKPKVMATQRELLDSRYNLEPKLDPKAKMSRASPWWWDRPRAAGRNDWDALAR